MSRSMDHGFKVEIITFNAAATELQPKKIADSVYNRNGITKINR